MTQTHNGINRRTVEARMKKLGFVPTSWDLLDWLEDSLIEKPLGLVDTKDDIRIAVYENMQYGEEDIFRRDSTPAVGLLLQLQREQGTQTIEDALIDSWYAWLQKQTKKVTAGTQCILIHSFEEFERVFNQMNQQHGTLPNDDKPFSYLTDTDVCLYSGCDLGEQFCADRTSIQYYTTSDIMGQEEALALTNRIWDTYTRSK